MKKGTTKVAFLVTCLAAVVASAFLKVHYVLDGGGGMLLWNTTESYLFLHVVERGYRVSYLEYPWEFFKQFFHSVPLPDDERFSLVVVRVTPSTIERHVVDMPADTPGNDPTLFTQFDHQVFANCEGVLCRWTGTHFEKATEQEQRNVAGMEHLSPDINTDFPDWHKRGVGFASDNYQYSVEVGKQLTLLVRNRVVNKTGSDIVSVDLQRPDQTAERIWNLEGRARRVSRAEYEQLFQRR